MISTRFMLFILAVCIAVLCCITVSYGISAYGAENTNEKVPPLIDSAYVSSKTAYFQVTEGAIHGDGAKQVELIFQESQFVVFGERHNSTRTSELITALIPIMDEHSYDVMCLEIGPHSASKLKELIRPSEDAVDNLRAFNTRYYHKDIDDVVIPFVSGVEDADFLREASKYNMDIWGLDQEYYYSILYMTDELLALVVGDDNYNQITGLKLKADAAIMKWFIEENNSDEEIDVFNEILNEEDVQSFFSAVEDGSVEAKLILDDLRLSWDIYTRWRSDSHADRVSYMRTNFMKHYNAEIEKTGKAPKVFLKFGQLHVLQIISNGAYDLGYLLNEIAQKDGLKCSNINSWTRYYMDEGVEIDYLEKYAKYYDRYKLLYQFGRREDWAIMDLASIREDVRRGIVALPQDGDFHKLNALIQAFDYQLIKPLDQEIAYNMESIDKK